MKLTLLNFNSDEEINLDAEKPVIIGRGPLFGCSDKRVSRNHGQVKLTPDGKVHVIALHSNPCFFMKNGLPPVFQLLKNEEKVLNDGDYVGLLPDSFWFKIIVKEDGLDSVSTCERVEIDESSVTNVETAIDTTDDILPEPPTEEDKTQPPESEKMDQRVSEPNGTESCSLPMDKLTNLEKTKKLPLWMYEIDEFPQDSGRASLKRGGSVSESSVAQKKMKSSLSPREDDVEDKPRSPSSSSKDQDQSKDRSSSPDSGVHKDCRVMDDEDAGEVFTEATAVENVSESSAEEIKAVSEVASQSSDVVRKRSLCQYEDKCYRKSEQHKKEFCHPGDEDFVPYNSRPHCQYGSSCYRRNKYHWVEFQHPKGNGANDGRQSAKAAGQARRNVRETDERSSDEDDFDFEEPFIDDGSSDEFIPSDLSSDEVAEDTDLSADSDGKYEEEDEEMGTKKMKKKTKTKTAKTTTKKTSRKKN